MAKQPELQLPANVPAGSLRARRLERLHAKGRLRAEEVVDSDTGERKTKLYKVLDDAVEVPHLSTEQDPDHDETTVKVWPEQEDAYRRSYEVNKAWAEFAAAEGLDVNDPELSVAIQRMTLPGREDPTSEQAEMFALYNGLRTRFQAEHPEFYGDEEE